MCGISVADTEWRVATDPSKALRKNLVSGTLVLLFVVVVVYLCALRLLVNATEQNDAV